jgi:hypothetical protein
MMFFSFVNVLMLFDSYDRLHSRTSNLSENPVASLLYTESLNHNLENNI